jgi:poly-gamma-glutamate synthesis protein (capsule biosynthesis protein)
MAGVGCNVINTASNHSSDKTQAVIDANVAIWQKIQGTLTVAGQNSSEDGKQKVHYFEVDGMKYAFLAYTTYSNATPPTTYGVNMYSRDFASRQIEEAKAAGATFILVSMRWGTEYSQQVNAYQLSESQFLADKGVNVIVGHGPHVLEPVKRLKGSGGNDTIVWYSLGNFLHAQLEAETLFNGIAVMDIDPKTGSVQTVGFLPTYMHYDWTAQQAASEDLLSRKNFELVPVEKANDLFKKSQLKTTIQAQQDRIKNTLNTFTDVKMLTLSDLGI